MEFDTVLLSRIQFALTIMFHYLFPPLTIGMGVVLVYLGGMGLKTGDPAYKQAQKFWTKVFALNFAIGVASGIVMEFQFGTNWSTYSRFVGDVFGSALAAEGIFAFFLESGFLAVLVFGWNRVGPKMHFFATCMVAMGSIFSSIWIVVANSWQQTPAGSKIVPMTRQVLDDQGHPLRDEAGNVVTEPWIIDGVPIMRAEITDFWAMVLNPSTVHRLTHVLLGCFIMGAFFVLSISAWYVLNNKHVDFAKRSFAGALVLAMLSSIAIAITGHSQAQNVYHYQPAKLATFEAHFHSDGRADLTLFGIPDAKNETIHARIAIPGALSFLVHDDTSFSQPVIGLDKIRPNDRPPMWIPFIAWRVMVGSGTFFIVLTVFSCFLLWKGTLFDHRWLMRTYVGSVLLAVAANQLGWIAAEVGRQPWIVHPAIIRNDAGEPVLDDEGYIQYEKAMAMLPDGTPYERFAGLRTEDGVSKAVAAEHVAASIVLFLLIYLLLGAVWVFVLNQKIQLGPEAPEYGFGESGLTSYWKTAAEQSTARMMIDSPSRPAQGVAMTDFLSITALVADTGLVDFSRETLANIWFVLLAFLLTGYAILDGFDLGVGILHPFVARTDNERRLVINSIGPLWDGNEVWLVTFGGALFAAFPEAYATVFSAFYLPFMALLFALILRAVSLEFRSKVHSPGWRSMWDYLFFSGSTLATFLYGVAVGNMMQGIPLDNRHEYTGQVTEMLNLYSLTVGVIAIAAFALHGAIYLYLKTEHELQIRFKKVMWRTFFAFAPLYLIVSTWTGLSVPRAVETLNQFPILWVVPALNLLAVLNIPRAIYQGRESDAFLSSSCMIAAFVTLYITALFPYLVPAGNDPSHSLTIINAASSQKTLSIMLLIAALGMPCVLAYSATIYWTFRGKVEIDETSY